MADVVSGADRVKEGVVIVKNGHLEIVAGRPRRGRRRGGGEKKKTAPDSCEY